MILLHLFRVRVEIPKQASLLVEARSPGELLREMVNERPSAELREGYTWHIGNIARVDSDAVYLALGRTTKTIVERFDDQAGNFVEEPFESAPYTHVLVDLDLGLAAIAVKCGLRQRSRASRENFRNSSHAQAQPSGAA